MRGRVYAAVTRWWQLPVQGGFAELDEQIRKFRQLKVSFIQAIAAADHEAPPRECH